MLRILTTGLIVCFILFTIILKATAQTVYPSQTSTPTATVSATIFITTTLTHSPTIGLETSPFPSITTLPTPIPKIVIEAISACPEDGQEWVMLKNLADYPANYDNWQLIDAANTKETINEINIESQQNKKFYLQTVKLNNGGDTLSLKNSSGQEVDHISYTSCTNGELIYFYQENNILEITLSPIPSLTTTLIINDQEQQSQLNNKPSIEQIKPTYKLPKLNNLEKTRPQQLQQTSLIENILYKPLPIDYWPIASVIIGGILLCLVGWFFIYETSRSFLK